MLKYIINKLTDRSSLSQEEAIEALNIIMESKATSAQIGGFLTALKMKGETVEEITGCAKVMKQRVNKLDLNIDFCIDTCGTGGDKSFTFNISTAVAIIAAAGKVVVAKHGNRSVSSKSGSADVLEALGVNISLGFDKIKECIERIGIGFMFAPDFHTSMKNVASVRKELGIRTIFDILAPLTNPANTKGQVLGVYNPELTDLVARVLINLDVERALVLHGMDGLDEISISTKTKVSEIMGNQVLNYEIHPEMFNIKTAPLSEVVGGDAKQNADIILSIFEGQKGPKRDIVVLNSAAALYIGKAVNSLKDGVALANEIIDSKKAMKKLYELKGLTNMV